MSENGNDVLLVEPEQTVSYSHTPTIGKLVGALALATKSFDVAKKNASNPAYHGSRYAPLETLIDATREALCDNGLAVIQLPKLSGKNVILSTLLAHSSGEWICGELELPATMRDRFDAQSVGSGITYARRYAYQSILNIAGEVDDDGNAAAGVGTKEAAQSVAKETLADKPAAPFIEFRPSEPGFMQIIGPTGIPMMRANMTADEQALMVWLQNARAWAIATEAKPTLVAICKKFNIEVREPAAPNGKPAPLASKDLTIRSATPKSKGKSKWLEVMYGNDAVSQKLGCWDKDLWPHLQNGVGQTADLITKPGTNPLFTNIVGFNRIGTQTFTKIDGKYVPDIQTETLPYEGTDADIGF